MTEKQDRYPVVLLATDPAATAMRKAAGLPEDASIVIYAELTEDQFENLTRDDTTGKPANMKNCVGIQVTGPDGWSITYDVDEVMATEHSRETWQERAINALRVQARLPELTGSDLVKVARNREECSLKTLSALVNMGEWSVIETDVVNDNEIMAALNSAGVTLEDLQKEEHSG